MAVWSRLRRRSAKPSGEADGDAGGGRRWRWVAVVSAVVIVLGVGVYIGFQRVRPYLHGSACEVRTSAGKMQLSLEQGANSATIAAVAFRKHLPERAVVIAYATAIQESDLRNLAGGDRDSVGMFQQRPSQGWGTPDKLRDPVQSTSKFFDALVKVKDYLDRDLHDAAQRVQRSADGTAYAQHEPNGKLLARAFTGREAGAARCWYTPGKRTAPRRTEAVREMRRAFGGRLQVTDAGGHSAVQVSNARSGWAVASWAMTHAQVYGLTEVRYAGLHWRAEAGHDGWTKDPGAPAGQVVLR